MLIEFSVGNFFSFKEPITFSMVSSNTVKELTDTNTFIDSTDKFRLLKTTAVYGNNASGKSNLVASISYMKRFVLFSFQNSLNDERNQKLKISNFLLDEKYESEPTMFEIVFIHNLKRYRYGFEILNGLIESEWLFVVNKVKELELFMREKNEIKFNTRSFKEGKDLQAKTKDNVLFLSVVAQFNGSLSNQIMDWFKNIKLISGLKDYHYQDFTINLFSNDTDFLNWAKFIVEFLDINNIVSEEIITNIEKSAIPDLKDENIKKLFDLIDKISAQSEKTEKRLFTLHQKLKRNEEFSEISFDVETQESEGTKKLLYLLGPIYDVLKKGSILIVDELDSRFHPLLTMKIIELFNRFNYNNAQLIFTSHDTNLLRNTIFRRDQIWFTEKTSTGATDLYSLVEYRNYRARKDATFSKDYLNGKYGAIPIFGDFERIMDLIYG